MSNKIPRTAKQLTVEFLIDTSVGRAGTKLSAEKLNDGWHGTDKNKKRYCLLLNQLRNEHLCKLSDIK